MLFRIINFIWRYYEFRSTRYNTSALDFLNASHDKILTMAMKDERQIISQSDNILLISAMGIPAVDIIVRLENGDLLDKFDIPMNGHRPVSRVFIEQMEKEIHKYSTDIFRMTGGCAQNTLKVFQWLVKTKYRSAMIGAVGCDDNGALLQQDLRNNGVIPLYAKIKDTKTCSVYAFTYGNNVSYVYDLITSAARLYSFDHLIQQQEALYAVQNSKIVLFEGFFTSLSVDVSLRTLDMCKKSSAFTVFNICGEYLPTAFPNAILPFVENCDVVIGNKMEFLCLCRAMNVSTDRHYRRALVDIHKTMISRQPSSSTYEAEATKRYRKILLVTDGKEPVSCVYGSDSAVFEYRLTSIEPELVRDTTGAGDSFLAGFLYGILNNFTIEKCLEVGHRAAAEIIKQKGCVVPNNDPSSVINV